MNRMEIFSIVCLRHIQACEKGGNRQRVAEWTALAHLAGMLLACDSCYLSFPIGRIYCKFSVFLCFLRCQTE